MRSSNLLFLLMILLASSPWAQTASNMKPPHDVAIKQGIKQQVETWHQPPPLPPMPGDTESTNTSYEISADSMAQNNRAQDQKPATTGSTLFNGYQTIYLGSGQGLRFAIQDAANADPIPRADPVPKVGNEVEKAD